MNTPVETKNKRQLECNVVYFGSRTIEMLILSVRALSGDRPQRPKELTYTAVWRKRMKSYRKPPLASFSPLIQFIKRVIGVDWRSFDDFTDANDLVYPQRLKKLGT